MTLVIGLLAAGLARTLAAQTKELPLKYVGPPTTTDITAGDLMTRLYKFADDSMMGRPLGKYHAKASAYIESEVRRLGLKPGGEDGTFFQNLPFANRALDSASTITSGEETFRAGADFVAFSIGIPRQYTNAQVVFGGTSLDTTNIPSADQISGKVVLVQQFMPPRDFDQAKFYTSYGYKRYYDTFSKAAATVVITNQITPAMLQNAFAPARATFLRPTEFPIALSVTTKMAEALFGQPISELAKGAAGKSITSDIRFRDDPRQLGRNVIAILEGSDPKLRGEFVAIGAHSDHVGFTSPPVDHDSVKAFMQIVRPQGADNQRVAPTADQISRVKAITDSLHVAHGGARLDSIYNGADDDGSGSVSVLEIAEAFAAARVKPKRSIVFVWHAGEESGMLGSGLFTDRPLPSVPRDSIVAQLNMDMVGRGAAADATGETKDGSLLHGGKGYLQLVGSRRLSSELGDLVETVNREQKLGFVFDYNIDANGHPQNIYCRSDHWAYAKWGIPVVFFTTGGHADYHQITDEPQYIDYDHMADVARLVRALAIRVADLDHRIVVDKPKPNPMGPCQQ